MNELDAVRLNFTPGSLIALDVILAFVLFGVALDMHANLYDGFARDMARLFAVGAPLDEVVAAANQHGVRLA